VDGLRNDYGVTVDPEVRIRMQRDRLQLAGERRGLAGPFVGPFASVAWQASRTRYQHQEVEGDGAVGTTFKSTGQELRVQAEQAPLALAGGTLRGVLGLQTEALDFSALGEEAFVPGTRTRSQALFTVQELALGMATLQAGVRMETVKVRSDGDAADATEVRFGPALSRSFRPRSLSLGVLAPLGTSGWRASASVGSTQRAPAYYELFANGLHVATGAYEEGDVGQRLERSRHVELGLQWQQAGHSLRVALWQTRFANYIALDATGATVPAQAEDGSAIDVPVYRFTGVPARLQGGEIEARSRLATGAWLAGWTLDASAGLDWVRGDNLGSGQPLPRIAPLRLQAGLDAARGAWRGGVQLRHAARQDRVPATDLATPGWTTLDLWASWAQRLGPGTDAVWTLKLTNLSDALATNASALLTARELSPAGGRALQASVRVGF
jgi:iron complex outermembrane receptor protein